MKPPKVTALTGKKMSVAIGARYEGGLILCTDSKVVLSDSSTKIGFKLSIMHCGRGTFAIANSSTNDGNAGKVLVDEITNDISKLDSGGLHPFIEAIKDRLRRWHAGYGSPSEKPPGTQFIIVAQTRGYSGLFFCEPPQTVIYEPHEPMTIGAGAASVEPLLPMVLPSTSPLRPTILKLAYLMYRAKMEQGALVGGSTDLVVIKADGNAVLLTPGEMNTAEKAIQAVDVVLRDCCAGLMCCEPEKNQQKSLARFDKFFMKKSAMFRNISFPSLKGFD